MSRRLAWLWLAVSAGFAACASDRPRAKSETRTVEAEGWAPFDTKDEADSRRRALADAQKQAVEKAAGVFVAARTRVDSAVVVAQRVVSDAKGRIVRYEVLNEKTDEGFLKLRIRAVVALEPDGEAPFFVFPEVKLGLAVDNDDAARGLRGELVAKGCAFASAGEKADVVLRGETRISPVKHRALNAYVSYRARLSVDAVATDGRVIWSGAWESAALGVDPPNASSRAAERAGTLVAAAAIKELPEALWNRR